MGHDGARFDEQPQLYNLLLRGHASPADPATTYSYYCTTHCYGYAAYGHDGACYCYCYCCCYCCACKPHGCACRSYTHDRANSANRGTDAGTGGTYGHADRHSCR